MPVCLKFMVSTPLHLQSKPGDLHFYSLQETLKDSVIKLWFASGSEKQTSLHYTAMALQHCEFWSGADCLVIRLFQPYNQKALRQLGRTYVHI